MSTRGAMSCTSSAADSTARTSACDIDARCVRFGRALDACAAGFCEIHPHRTA